MRAFIRLFDFSSWPIWAKLSAGFLLAIVLPVSVVVFIAGSRMLSLSGQSLRIYMNENGERQRLNIQAALDRAQSDIEKFATNPDNTNQIIGLLLSNVQTNPPLPLSGASATQVADLLRNELFGPAGNLFDTVLVLNRQGIVVSAASETNLVSTLFGRDDSDTPAFTEAINMRDLNQAVTLSRSPLVSVHITQAIRWRDGTVLGFIVAALSNEQVFYNQLAFASDSYPAYSFLVGGIEHEYIFSPAVGLVEARQSVQDSPVVALALEGETGLINYTMPDNQEILTYYGAIYDPAQPDTVLLALVSEVSAAVQVNTVLNYFAGARTFALVVGPVVLLFLLVILFNQTITLPLLGLRSAIQAMARRDYDQPVQATQRQDEIGTLNAAFVDMRQQVRGQINVLETRIAAQSRDIATTQEISRFAASQRDLQVLLDKVVDLIVERFSSIYHAQIFLLDEVGEYAVLRASTGEPGRELLSRGHKLAVGSLSVIGRVVEQGRIIVARDTATSEVHRRNEFLPDTRSELAIPLLLGGAIIGALDVQSRRPDVFEPDEISVLQTMADQITVVIDNARLYQDTLRVREEIQQANREATLRAWREFMYEQRYRELVSEAGVNTGSDLTDLRHRALQNGRITIGEVTARGTIPVAVPIQLRGTTLGAVEWELPAGELNETKLQLAQELANRMAIGLDSTRLFEESQRATERERIVNSIAAKLTPQTAIEDILETAVREIGEALHLPHVSIRLHGEQKNGHDR
ncbi:MAG: GAF domain-containing protein [Anaerolineaceae bacterium]|nr:GAF domain-containing protein [Anaerolineaceae bacterium]